MKLRFKPEAEKVLFEIASWVEHKNTVGSGSRFINRFIDKIQAFAIPNVTYPICKNLRLARLGLQCVVVGKWVIAFKSDRNNFIVHYIIYGEGLK